MATTTTISSNYEGQEAGERIGRAFKAADTLSRDLVTILPNIPFKASLKKIQYANGRQDYACGFTPAGAVTLSEKFLTPKKIMNPIAICKEDFRQTWGSASMGFGAANAVIPKDEETALIAQILGDTAEATDSDIWNGVSATSGSFGGFIPQFSADADIIKAGSGITSLGAAIDKANVVSEIEKVLNAIPVAVRKSPSLVVGISDNVALAYEQALISAGISNGLGGGDMPLRYGRYTLEPIGGLPDNTFVAYDKKNLNFGTGLMSDHNELKLVDEDEIGLLTGMIRGKMVYTAGVGYVIPEEIVWYLSTT